MQQRPTQPNHVIAMEESVGSNSPPAIARRQNPSNHISKRISRALHHRLHLLHRNGANFYILGATGNVYTVTLSTIPSCTCPDRIIPCKHIFFVFLRVLGLSRDDPCFRRRTLRPNQLARMLAIPSSSPHVYAGPRARERFHQLFSGSGDLIPRPLDDETIMCPVCLEEMVDENEWVCCGTCGNSIHKECFKRWKQSRGRRAANCVICRARWRDINEQSRYVNLATYVEEDIHAPAETAGTSCARRSQT